MHHSRFALLVVTSFSILCLVSCVVGEPAGSVESPEGSSSSLELGPPPSSPIIPSPLTDQSRSLVEILEHGTLSKADCDRYFAGQTDRETTLRCGKWMYFYAHLEVPGSPAELIDLIRKNAPRTVGRSLEHVGLYPDPYSTRGLPVGLTDGPKMAGGVTTYTVTCASCHFGKTNDGRFVVGQPNATFAFGKYILAVSSLPELAALPHKKLAPEVERVLGPIRDEVFGNPLTRLGVIWQAIRLLPSLILTQATPPDDAAKLDLAVLPPGVMDPFAPPSIDDRVRIPMRMGPVWGIDPVAMTAAGSTHGAMLGSNGGAPDLTFTLRTFAFTSGRIRRLPLGQNYDPEKLRPLIEYVMSLNPPRPEKALDATQVAQGQRLFHDKCFSCHNGPAYAGLRIFDPLAIGTDPNVIRQADPDLTGRAIYDVFTPQEMTQGVRARRLSGVWSLGGLLHNASVSSLEELFCLNGPRSPSTLGSGYSNAGHDYTCDGLANEEKQSLIQFLESL